MKDTAIVSTTENKELTFSDSNDNFNKIEVPTGLIDSVNNIIRDNISKSNILSAKDKAEELWEVTIKPEFKDGLDKGLLSMKEGSLEIRNVKTGRYIGKANLDKVDAGKLIEMNEPSAISKLTSSVAGITGQLQMAEISKKLDVIHEKVDLLGQFMWRDKVSEVHSLNSVIEEAIDSLPNEHAVQRINDSIINLKKLAIFFESTIKEVLSRKIDYNLMNNFIDGLKVWELKKEKRFEYNHKYNKEIQLFINEYRFLLDLYFQTLGLIGTCYQITNEYHHASKYYRKISTDIDAYSIELSDRLGYLLNIEENHDNEEISLVTIGENIKTRKLPKPLLEEIKISETKINEVNNMHKMLSSQFENVQLSYEIDTKLLMEGVVND